MAEELLDVRLLGDFTMTWRGRLLVLPCKKNSRPQQLLWLMLYYHEKRFTRAAAAEALLGSGPADPAATLRGLRFRLHALLQAAGVPGEGVCAADGLIFWDPAVPVRTDADRFWAAAAQSEALQGEAALEKALDACRCYGGELLASQCLQDWALLENERLRQRFLELVRFCGGALCKKGSCAAAGLLYARAARMEPYEEEWCLGGIRCAARQGDARKAYRLYEEMLRRYAQELGTRPTAEFCRCMQQCGGVDGARQLRALLCAEGDAPQLCTAPELMRAAGLLCRLRPGPGGAGCVAWCRVHAADALQASACLGRLLPVLAECLPPRDVYAPCAQDQMLVLLPGIGRAAALALLERVRARLHTACGAQEATLECTVLSLDASCLPGTDV